MHEPQTIKDIVPPPLAILANALTAHCANITDVGITEMQLP